MVLKQPSIILTVTLAAGLAILLAACDFVMASKPLPASPPPPGRTQATSPAPSPTPTPDLQPTVDALVQRRIADILIPSPDSGTRPTPQPETQPAGQPMPQTVQYPAPIPVEDPQAEYYRSGFACTGSMRPNIDCGDEGVFLKPPFQEPLLVGDVISFSSEQGCRYYKNQDISKAHRIVSLRVEDGTTYYTTQGDAALTPDACEVTIEQVDGKLVELLKGARPQDIIDTSEYDFAKERVSLLKAQYEADKEALDQRQAEYDEKKEVVDRGQVEYNARVKEYELLSARYRSGNASYQEAHGFYQQLEEERTALNQLKEELNALGDDISAAIQELNSLGLEINAAIDEQDRIYQELFGR